MSAPDASTFMQDVTYTDQVSHEDRQTRVPPNSLTFALTSQDNKVYTVKFGNNFSKKHFFRGKRKQAAIKEQVDKMFLDSGAKEGPTEAHKVAGKRKADEMKMEKQVLHRSPQQQGKICTCGHEDKRHQTASKVAIPCKETGCVCRGFALDTTDNYPAKRRRQGKPTENPLQGMPTTVGTFIWLDEIPKASFEKVVTDPIVKRLKDPTAWNIKGEPFKWDFGATLKGCVQVSPGNTPLTTPKQGVEVLVKNLTTDPTLPTFEVLHLHGQF